MTEEVVASIAIIFIILILAVVVLPELFGKD
jgi:hypothetical protein